jgi:hypothetical protein
MNQNDAVWKGKRKELMARVKLAARARGIVFVFFTTADCKAVVGKTLAQLAATKIAAPPGKAKTVAMFRYDVRAQLRHLEGAPSQNAFCGSLPAVYKRQMLLGEVNPDSANGLKRKDTAMILAFQLKNPAVGAPPQPSNELVGVVSYGSADPDDFDGAVAGPPASPAQRAAINSAIADADSALELDMICVHGATRSTGALLTAFVLAKEFARTKRGAARYTSAFSELVRSEYPHYPHGAPNPNPRPFEGPAKTLGFVNAGFTLAYPDGSVDGDYFALIPTPQTPDVVDVVLEHFDEAFPRSELMYLCPLEPRTGLRQCQ